MSPYDPDAWNWGEDRSTYELVVWFACDAGGDESECGGYGDDYPDTTHGLACRDTGSYEQPPWVQMVSYCDTTTDSGNVVIKVSKPERYGRCDSYQLEITVH
jgi:hypothetical protein